MPRPIPDWKVPYVLVMYLAKRQLDGRPTTLKEVTDRLGLGSAYLLGILEKFKVRYALINHNEKNTYSPKTTEVVLGEIPEDLAFDTGVSRERLILSYEKIFNTREMPDLVGPEKVDAFDKKRLTERQFKVLEPFMITRLQLLKLGMEAGYSQHILLRAMGEAGRFKPPSSVWLPHIYRGKYYYAREVLNHLEECEQTYRRERYTRKYKEEKKRKEEEKEKQENFLLE